MRKTKLYVLRLAMKPMTVLRVERFRSARNAIASTKIVSSGLYSSHSPGRVRIGSAICPCVPQCPCRVRSDLRIAGRSGPGRPALTAIMMAARVTTAQEAVCSKGMTPVTCTRLGGMLGRLRCICAARWAAGLSPSHAAAAGEPAEACRQPCAGGRAFSPSSKPSSVAVG